MITLSKDSGLSLIRGQVENQSGSQQKRNGTVKMVYLERI